MLYVICHMIVTKSWILKVSGHSGQPGKSDQSLLQSLSLSLPLVCTSYPNSTLRLETKFAKTSNEFNSSLSREVQLWKGPDGADCPWGTCIVLTLDSVSSLGDDKQSRSTAGCWSKGVHYVEGRGERTRPQACLESGWDTGTVGWYNITIYCCFILNQNISIKNS